MDCIDCGEPTRGASRCPACQRPVVGQPRAAPEGSSNRPPMPPSGPRTANLLVWGAVVGVLLAVITILALRVAS